MKKPSSSPTSARNILGGRNIIYSLCILKLFSLSSCEAGVLAIEEGHDLQLTCTNPSITNTIYTQGGNTCVQAQSFCDGELQATQTDCYPTPINTVHDTITQVITLPGTTDTLIITNYINSPCHVEVNYPLFRYDVDTQTLHANLTVSPGDCDCGDLQDYTYEVKPTLAGENIDPTLNGEWPITSSTRNSFVANGDVCIGSDGKATLNTKVFGVNPGECVDFSLRDGGGNIVFTMTFTAT